MPNISGSLERRSLVGPEERVALLVSFSQQVARSWWALTGLKTRHYKGPGARSRDKRPRNPSPLPPERWRCLFSKKVEKSA
jgi:hypothetical protein